MRDDHGLSGYGRDRAGACRVAPVCVALVALGFALAWSTAGACGSRSATPTGRLCRLRAPSAATWARRATLGSQERAYVGVAPRGAVVRRRPGGAIRARFGPRNINDYPTVFGVVGVIRARDCTARWYRVQLPMKPNGATGFVNGQSPQGPNGAVEDRGRPSAPAQADALHRARLSCPCRATVAVGSPSTPTPTGRYYVNQRLVPTKRRPVRSRCDGVSAFSNVLTGWARAAGRDPRHKRAVVDRSRGLERVHQVAERDPGEGVPRGSRARP